ncbi:MAG: nucleotidyltransferase family protein [Candidatus Portnoybacteria bacterium]|nr:nucleotidyltransferase family protein [Candidatus Portnoybacteria bacterium]
MFEKQIKKMSSTDVIGLYASLENLGIKIWLDGGWAVDALLEKETRIHSDLDIAIQRKDIPKFREYLQSQGYKEKEREEDKKWDFVFGDDKEREIDVHSFEFDDNGFIVEKDEYPDGSLDGIGTIKEQEVRCVAPKYLVQFHTRHKSKEKDYQDVYALCEKFGIEIPEEYIR